MPITLDGALLLLFVSRALVSVDAISHASREKHQLERTLSVQRGYCAFTPSRYTPHAFHSQTTPFDHSSVSVNQADSIPSLQRPSVSLRSLCTPSGITPFDPDHPGIFSASISPILHAHLWRRCQVCEVAGQFLAADGLCLGVIWIS